MLRTLYYLLSPSQRLLIRRIAFSPIDTWEKMTGSRPEGIPPRGMIYTGTGDFLRAGEKYLTFFREMGGLQPHHRVLDIGSGIGRMAIPLTAYLSAQGSYEGFDIVDAGIKWSRENITSKFPNFNFHLVDLKNDLYSASGNNADEFVFPYSSGDFDFVFLTSVFTHMIPAEVEHYMREINRVLKPGGICFSTFFTYGDLPELQPGKVYFNFPEDFGFYRLLDARVMSANVAFEYNYIKYTLAAANGFEIDQLHPGHWRDIRKKTVLKDFQDIVIFRKK